MPTPAPDVQRPDPRAMLRIAPEVVDALEAGAAVVALESTLISHGLPAPRNVDVAFAAEAAVRRMGAVPATVAVREGRLLVGLAADEIQALASAAAKAMGGATSGPPAESVAKASRHNLAAALESGGWAGNNGQRHDDRRLAGRHPRLRHRRHRWRPSRGRVEPRHLGRPRRAGADPSRGRQCRSEVDPRRAPHPGSAGDARRARRRARYR